MCSFGLRARLDPARYAAALTIENVEAFGGRFKCWPDTSMWNARRTKVPPAVQRGLRTIPPNVQLGFTLRKRPETARHIAQGGGHTGDAAGGEAGYLATPEFEAFMRLDSERWERFARAMKK